MTKSIYPGDTGMTISSVPETFFECGYCGGFATKDESGPGFTADTHTFLRLEFPQAELAAYNRTICPKCVVTVFDKVLGEGKMR